MGTLEYDRKSTRQVAMKLHTVLDKDVLEKLASVDNMQAYVKRLIRADIASKSASNNETADASEMEDS